MDATELLEHKRALKEMIRDAVERRDRQSLEAVSTAVYDLELEILESFWQLEQLAKGIKSCPASRLGRALLEKCETVLGGYSVLLMSYGVSLAWRAARIRSRIKGSPVPLEFEKDRECSSPLG